jgi:enamine deaminase RidA (YjgF/YER057c/UK114 family)
MRLLIGLLGVALAAFGAEVRVVGPVYLDDINDFAKMNRVYAQYFPEIRPSRTAAAQAPPPQDRGSGKRGHLFVLEQISFIAVR